MSSQPTTLLCISRYFKGADFMRYAKREGNRVFLLTSSKLKDHAWPWEAIDETFYLEEDEDGNWNHEHLLNGLAFKMRSLRFDRFVALDDFDVEKVAELREHFRIPGMGQTTARYFRDKLAMRMRAQEAGIPIPAFTPLFHDEQIRRFTAETPAPWMLKPRSNAAAIGMKKILSEEALWTQLEASGDERHGYLLERFAPGDVFHVDGLNVDGEVIFSRVSQYLNTPFEVAHGGGIFRSCTAPFDSEYDRALRRLNERVMKAFGMRYSATHTEFIRDKDSGEFYFLETSSRVGGANLADMVEAGSGINLWGEWARIETAMARHIPYQLPPARHDHAGIIVSLSRYEHPDLRVFDDPEVVWRMDKPWHVGLVLSSPDRDRILELLDAYAEIIHKDFHASLPAPDRPGA